MRQEWILSLYVPIRCHGSGAVLCAGRYRVAQAAEVRLFPLAHQLKVQRLLAEVALGRGVRLQLEAHLLPGLHQTLCAGPIRGTIRHRAILKKNNNNNTEARRAALLTDKVFHHLGRVVRSRGDAQKLIAASDCRVVDCLDVDVVTTHHEVTHLSVFLCIRHLKCQTGDVNRWCWMTQDFSNAQSNSIFQLEEANYPNWDDVTGAVHHREPGVH